MSNKCNAHFSAGRRTCPAIFRRIADSVTTVEKFPSHAPAMVSVMAMFYQLRDSFRVADQPPNGFPEGRFWITWVGGGKKTRRLITGGLLCESSVPN